MSVSSVPSIQFTPAGPVIPAEADVLAGVQGDINAAFGGGLNPALETPQGQLASSQAAVIADKNSEIAYICNQVDPLYADGRFQDAIGRLYFMDRKGATSTSVPAVINGPVGNTVPAGTLVTDTAGELYALTGAATIGVSGSVAVEVQNVNPGPIPCAANSLQVYQAAGFDTITNSSAGTPGRNVESRAEFEYRRKNSVSINANGTPGAIYAAVFAVDGVLDCYVLDNPTGATVNTGATAYPMLPHSVYVAAVGGVDADIAAAIRRKKDLGCDMNGNTTVNVLDTSGYSYPQPSYVITFERPAALALKFAVQIVNDPSLPGDIVSRVQAAIVARFNGADGTTRERIGALILASRYYGAVVSAADNVSLISILLGTSSPTLSQYAIGIDQRPTLSPSDITVTLV